MSPTQLSGADHDALVELLPWYANGTLEESDSARLQQHLSHCVTCQKELEWLQVTQHSIANQKIALPPVAHGLHSVLERINREGASKPETGRNSNGGSPQADLFDQGRKLKSWLHRLSTEFTTPTWAITAIAGLLIVTVTIKNGWLMPPAASEGPYTVLSSEKSEKTLKLQLLLKQPTELAGAKALLEDSIDSLKGPLQLTEQDKSHYVLNIPLSSLPADQEVETINQLILQLQQLPEVSQTELIP